MKKSITVEEFETLRQGVSTLIDHIEQGQLNPESLKSLHEYLQTVSVLPEFKHEATSKFHR